MAPRDPRDPRDPRAGSGDAHGRFRYSPWTGGADPLAPPFDVRSALDEVGRDVLAGGSLRESLRELMRRGLDGRRGLDDLADRVRRLREAARRRGDLGGTLDQVRAMLDQALAMERDQLAGEEGDDARLAEMDLATIPDDVAGAVRALGSHEWHSPEAKATYDEIAQMLQREVVGAQFEGMKQALSGNDPEAMQRVKDMLADLNDLLAAHARDEDTTDRFRDFMDKHGDLFPEQPESVDELIDALARRQAAAERLMASLSPEQREQLAQLMADALGDPDLASQMSQLADNLRALRPGLDRRGPVQQGRGGESLGWGEAVDAVAELADLEQLQEQLGQGYFGATLDDVDIERLEQYLGADAATDMEALRQLERELERQGFVSRGDDGLRLTPRAIRRLGETALRRVFQQVDAAGRGDHDDRAAGQADEPTGLTRQWEFGDELPLDTVRTVSNALQRNAARAGMTGEAGRAAERQPVRRLGGSRARGIPRRRAARRGLRGGRDGAAGAGGGGAVRRHVLLDDAGGALGADEADGARALAPRADPLPPRRAADHRLQPRGAAGSRPVELAEAEPEWVQGTNLQHALMLASRHLRRHPDAEPVVLVVTDGEPTAHIESDGRPTFHWPATQTTLRATVAQVDELRRVGGAAQRLHARRRPRSGPLRRRGGSAGRRAGLHAGHLAAGRVRRGRLPAGPPGWTLNQRPRRPTNGGAA